MKIIGRRKGQSLIEFAIVLPLLLWLIVALFDFGRIFNAQITVTQAAREGARRGIIPAASDTAALNNAQAAATAFANAAGLDNFAFSPAPSFQAGISGDNRMIVVTVNSNVNILAPIISQAFGSQITVSGSARMRAE